MTEKMVERQCIKLYQTLHCDVVKFSQPHKATGQTRGIADLLVYYKEHHWWHEVKRTGGKQSPHQKYFQEVVESHGETYIIGGLDAATKQLRSVGFAIGHPLRGTEKPPTSE